MMKERIVEDGCQQTLRRTYRADGATSGIGQKTDACDAFAVTLMPNNIIIIDKQ